MLSFFRLEIDHAYKPHPNNLPACATRQSSVPLISHCSCSQQLPTRRPIHAVVAPKFANQFSVPAISCTLPYPPPAHPHPISLSATANYPQLAWDGSTIGYEQRPYLSDPCTPTTAPPPTPSRPTPTITSTSRTPHPAATRLEAALDALASFLLASSPEVAEQLHAADLAATLRRLGEFDAPGVLGRVGLLYGLATGGCKAMRDEVLDMDCSAVALSGMLLHAAVPGAGRFEGYGCGGVAATRVAAAAASASAGKVRLSAARKLCAAVDGFSGREFPLLGGWGATPGREFTPLSGWGAVLGPAGSQGWSGCGGALAFAYAVVMSAGVTGSGGTSQTASAAAAAVAGEVGAAEAAVGGVPLICGLSSTAESSEFLELCGQVGAWSGWCCGISDLEDGGADAVGVQKHWPLFKWV